MGNQYSNVFIAPGTVINNKIVVEFRRTEKNSGIKIYLFRCIFCGFERESRTAGIKRRHSCSQCIRISINSSYDDMILSVYRAYRKKAINRKLRFELNEQEFKGIIEKSCHYCGINASNSVKWGKRIFNYNGIDRVNNNGGYTLENCVPCCKTCNSAKSNLEKSEFLDWIKRVHDHSVKGNKNQ